MARAMAQKDNPINAVLCLKKSSDSLATLVQLLPHERVKTLKPQTYEEVTMATTKQFMTRMGLGTIAAIILAMGVGTQALATDCNTDCGAKARFTYPCPTLRNPGRKCTGKNPVIYGACEVERAVACDNFLTQELFDKAKSLLSKNFNATVWSQSNPDVYMAECYIAAESIITLIGAEVGGPYGAAIAGGAGLFVAHRLCEQSTKW